MEKDKALQEQRIEFLNTEIKDLKEKLQINKKWDQLFDGICEFNQKPIDNSDFFKREIDRLEALIVKLKEENEGYAKKISACSI